MNPKYELRDLDPDAFRNFEVLRAAFSDLEEQISSKCKVGRELSLALTKLEEAFMWALKAL